MTISASDNDDRLQHYRIPGEVTVSEAAIEYAREFAEALSAVGPNSRWLVAFHWSTARSEQFPNGREEHFGPGLDLGGDRRDRYPSAALHDGGGFQFAVCMPKNVLDASKHRLIDVEPSEWGKLVLR